MRKTQEREMIKIATDDRKASFIDVQFRVGFAKLKYLNIEIVYKLFRKGGQWYVRESVIYRVKILNDPKIP